VINKALLKEKAQFFGVEPDEIALDRFDRYAEMLVETNKTMNLTAITEPDDIVIKHFADSLSLLKYADIPQGASIIDVGTGAGFPGVALLIARPDLKLTLLDSLNKRLVFLNNVLNELGLDAETVHSRAEDAGKNPLYREKFDFSVARAVAALPVLSEYCLPFVRVGGSFAAMKAASAAEEIANSERAVSILGGKITDDNAFDLFSAGERHIIVIKKISQTPTKYPRPSAAIARKSI
jgi:16S rRNA (guanine527-N7)-methyltransferase